MVNNSDFIIRPDWPAPKSVNAISTTRLGGVSKDAYTSNNLAFHVGDDPSFVAKNREQLRLKCQFPNEPNWLTQIHSNTVVNFSDSNCEADASFSNQTQQVCVVMTADCLPILICDNKGSQVAAVHAGWRGLANNIVENTIDLFQRPASDIIAWLGPAIGADHFEVGSDVKEAFVNGHESVAQYFKQTNENKYLADLYGLAKLRLNQKGVTQIYGGEFCTYSDDTRFFSYRRDNVCGRMASFIWLDK